MFFNCSIFLSWTCFFRVYQFICYCSTKHYKKRSLRNELKQNKIVAYTKLTKWHISSDVMPNTKSLRLLSKLKRHSHKHSSYYLLAISCHGTADPLQNLITSLQFDPRRFQMTTSSVRYHFDRFHLWKFNGFSCRGRDIRSEARGWRKRQPVATCHVHILVFYHKHVPFVINTDTAMDERNILAAFRPQHVIVDVTIIRQRWQACRRVETLIIRRRTADVLVQTDVRWRNAGVIALLGFGVRMSISCSTR